MVRFYKVFTFITILIVFPWGWANSIEAAALDFSPAQLELQAGDEAEIRLEINTQNQDINAVEGEVALPVYLEIKELRDADSVISLWVVRPSVSATGIIKFSGVIPGGYWGEDGKLFSLVVRAKQSGSGTVKLSGVRSLLNDGQGTAAAVDLATAAVNIKPLSQRDSLTIPPVNDHEPPEQFNIQLARDPVLFAGQYFAVFASQDKGSSLDYYEVAEQVGRPDGNEADLIWQRVSSPYVLRDQSLRSSLWVRAVDKAGNERWAVLPAQSKAWYEYYSIWLWFAIILGCAGWYGRRKIR